MNKTEELLPAGYTLIEGWDYCGKTTLAERLANTYGNSIYYHSPSGTCDFTKKMHNTITKNLLNIDPATMLGLQISLNIFNLRNIKKLVDDGFHVFSDRGLLSTLVYQNTNYDNLKNIIESLCDSIELSWFIPDSIILLTANLDTIISRKKEREKFDNWDDFAVNKSDMIESYLRNFKDIYHDYRVSKLTIPTDDNDENEVFNIVKSNIDLIY